MIVSELIAALQALPQDMVVYETHTPNCCCGECEMPFDDEREIDFPHVGEVRLLNEKTHKFEWAKAVVL